MSARLAEPSSSFTRLAAAGVRRPCAMIAMVLCAGVLQPKHDGGAPNVSAARARTAMGEVRMNGTPGVPEV